MEAYRKQFFVDIDDQDNPRALYYLVGDSIFKDPKINESCVEINGVKYIVAKIGEWKHNPKEKKKAARHLKLNQIEYNSLDPLLKAAATELKDEIKHAHYWEYQEILLKKTNN
jgi:hypothetical protein